MFSIFAAALFGALLRCDTPAADGPVTPCVESWCTMIQVVDKLREDITARQLSLVHNEDMPLNIAVSNLLREAATAPPGKRDELQLALADLARKVADLHTLADAAEQAKAEEQLVVAEQAFEKVRGFYGEEILGPARKLADRYTCPMHADVVGRKDDPCPKCGMPLDQLVRPALFKPGAVAMPAATIRASVFTDAPLQAGHSARVTIRLAKRFGDLPVTLADLREVHTQKIHLLIIDPSLTDYHHEHPQPTQTAGEYAFTFTPRRSGSYRVWADLRPAATGFQEYVRADIAGEGPPAPLTDKTAALHAEVEGLRYDLTLAQSEIKAGQPVAARLRITDSEGAPFAQLEPIMATYAHLVGFGADYQTVLHMHPQGPPALDPHARGGPELEFLFYAPQPGFIRLFAQVQIGGVSKFAPFGLLVKP